MTHRSDLLTGVVLLLGSALGPAVAVATPNAKENVPMLVDRIPADMWTGQRVVLATEYPEEQESFRADVTHFLKGRFRVTKDRLFVIPPDHGIMLMGGPFQLGGPGQLQTIDSAPVFYQLPHVRVAPDARTGSIHGKTILTVGATLSGAKVYTAIALHQIPDSTDELIGYFQLEPLIADPAKGL